MTEKQAIEYIYSHTPIDYITEIFECPDCYEIYGMAGGDSLHYRLYKDGRLYER